MFSFWARAGDLGWAPGLGLGLGWLGPGLGLASSTIFSTGRRARAINFDHRDLFSVVLFVCSKRSDCAFLVLQKPNMFVCLCVFCCAFLVLEAIRPFCFSCARNDPIVFFSLCFSCAPKAKCVCVFFCAFLVLETIGLLCFSGAPKSERVCMFVLFLCAP